MKNFNTFLLYSVLGLKVRPEARFCSFCSPNPTQKLFLKTRARPEMKNPEPESRFFSILKPEPNLETILKARAPSDMKISSPIHLLSHSQLNYLFVNKRQLNLRVLIYLLITDVANSNFKYIFFNFKAQVRVLNFVFSMNFRYLLWIDKQLILDNIQETGFKTPWN